MTSLTIAADGLLGNINSLVIASRGLLQAIGVAGGRAEDDYPYDAGFRGGIRRRRIQRDDEEILQIIIQAITNGIIN